MFDKLATYIVYLSHLSHESPASLLVVILVHKTGLTKYKVLCKHTMCVISLYFYCFDYFTNNIIELHIVSCNYKCFQVYRFVLNRCDCII